MTRFVCLLLTIVSATVAKSQTLQQAWINYRNNTLKDKALIRFYTFQDIRQDKKQIPDSGTDGCPLEYVANGEPFTLLPGRFPGKQAVRLDKSFLAAKPFTPEKQTFTAQAWIKLLGPGSYTGHANSLNGAIMSVGIGFWDGWRLTTSFPDGRLAFQLGRPKGINAFGISSAVGLQFHAWQHVAISWNGKTMKIYLNGLLVRQDTYTEPYTPHQPDAALVIGYAGYGIGSASMLVDEVAVHSRELSAHEIRQAALVTTAIPATVDSIFQALQESSENLPESLLRQLAQDPQASPYRPSCLNLIINHRPGNIPFPIQALESPAIWPYVREQLAGTLLHALERMPDLPIPDASYRLLLALPNLTPPQQQSLTLNRILQQILTATTPQQLNQAQEHAQTLLATPEMSHLRKQEIKLAIAHAYRASQRYDLARNAYLSLADSPQLSPLHAGIARLAAAQVLVLHHKPKQAVKEFLSMAGDKRFLQHHRQEAEQCAKELSRAQHQLPPRNPEESRRRPPAVKVPQLAVFVSPHGDDTNNGSSTQPVATLPQALLRIRALRAKAQPQPAAIVLREGTYSCQAPLVLTAQDSGTADAPFTIMAQPGEHPVLSGGIRVRNFISETDPNILKRLTPKKRIPLLVADLPPTLNLNLPNHQRPRLELFCNGKPLTMARYPNRGYVLTGKDIRVASKQTTVQYTDPKPEHWNMPQDIWITGYLKHIWATKTFKITDICPRQKCLELDQTPPDSIKTGKPFFYENVLEEIDQPGEWTFDRTSRKLYLYPTMPIHRAKMELSKLDQPFITAEDVDFLIIHGLTFKLSQADAIVGKGLKAFRFSGNTVTSIAGNGLVVTNAPGATVYGNDFIGLGKGGVRIGAGNRKNLEPGNVNIENNWFNGFSRVERSYTPAIQLHGCGNRIAHNLIQDSPHHAIRLEGNDFIVEFNEVHSVVYESDDQGAVDMWGNPAYRGNIFRYNFWHHINSGRNYAGQAGIRLDDAICGTLIYSNIFLHAAGGNFGAVQIHGGKENLVDNNLFVDCQAAVSFSTWEDRRWNQFLKRKDIWPKLTKHIQFNKPPYSTKYPTLLQLEQNNGFNDVTRNLSVRCRRLAMRQKAQHTFFDNRETDARNDFNPGPDNDYKKAFSQEQWRNIIRTSAMNPIPFQEIGLYPDEARASLPDHRETATISPNYRGDKR